ncbi:MAG: ATP-binding cassette domain-containing protein [Candidatus Gracilibacteria bacterium]|nr:ATP-binding cassette domain-containing protein [Candidatus Gracilibacteria bacterium]
MQNTENILEIKNLTKKYKKLYAIKNININIKKGSVYGFIGDNGAGKSTTLKILAGIIGKDSGEINIFGKPWNIDALAKVGSLVETPVLYEKNTGRENLEIFADLVGQDYKKVDEIFKLIKLNKTAQKKLVGKYSLGMKQRLAIGVTLLKNPEFLILDEPTNGLDIRGIRDVRNLIADLSEHGITVIVSSHQLYEIQKACSHIGVIKSGEIKFEGTIKQYMTLGDNIEDIYLKITE